MATVNLQAQPREGIGKGTARRLRADGRIPAVLYGADIDDPRNLSVDSRELWAALHTSAGSRVVITLDIAGDSGKSSVALVREIQRHPVTDDYLHADLVAIDLSQPVEVNLPIHAVGTPIGVKLEDGVLEWARREIMIRVLPTAIPESYELDISEMHVGDSVHISDLTEAKFEILEDEHLTICTVKTTRIAEELPEDEEVAEGEEAAEGEAAEGEEPSAEGESAEEKPESD